MYDKDKYGFQEADALPSVVALPDLLRTPDGKKITTAGQWTAETGRLKAMAEHYLFGDIPPIPDRVDAEILGTLPSRGDRTVNLLRINIRDVGDTGRDFSFRATQVLPAKPVGARVIVKNSGNHLEPCPIEDRLVAEGIELITFNRTDVAPDGDDMSLGLYPCFPSLHLKCLAAWAWGHMAVDSWIAARGGDGAPRPRICIMGHSRGGKATTCAGVFDERIDVVTSSGSGCGGAGCFRFAADMDPKAETLGNITGAFPFWFADRLRTFSGREDRLPFDLHTLKALVAPRALITTEGNQDYWSNPVGSGVTSRAAQPVFDLLGVPGRNAIYYRDGGHAQNVLDWNAIVDFFLDVT